jgi:hypothetical protein
MVPKPSRPSSVSPLQGEKSAEAAIVCAFNFGREKTGWQFSTALMIGKAFATVALPGAGFISAIASLKILVVVLTILLRHPFPFRCPDELVPKDPRRHVSPD